MQQGHQGNLANLWAVGGKQAGFVNAGRNRIYYQFCHQCGWKLTGKFSTCPRCGADLGFKPCPYCGEEIPGIAKRCPRCSACLE